MRLKQVIERYTYLKGTFPFFLPIVTIILVHLLKSEILTLILFTILLISYIFRKYDSRILIGSALFLLALCPIFLILKKELVANKIAIYAYYFLVIGVIKQLIEYLKEKNVKESE